jgi:hypothetical protein
VIATCVPTFGTDRHVFRLDVVSKRFITLVHYVAQWSQWQQLSFITVTSIRFGRIYRYVRLLFTVRPQPQ